MHTQTKADSSVWPSLRLEAWQDTYATLHLWTQIIGKIRMVQSPWLNHSWHVTLFVTARGLSTNNIAHGTRIFQIQLDFIEHRLIIQTSDGDSGGFPLQPQSVAVFYARLMQELKRLQLPVILYTKPCEVVDPLPFEQDETHCSYDAEYAQRFWKILLQVERVMQKFRVRFNGKCSPVHYFWGAADLALTRFSGRRAPQHPGGVPGLPDWVTREAYSHEVSSCGFWPGGGALPYPAFYAYTYPEPAGYAAAAIKPDAAFYNKDLHEFILPYDAVRQAADPDELLLEFFQTSYAAAADLGKWDRTSLERDNTQLPPVR